MPTFSALILFNTVWFVVWFSHFRFFGIKIYNVILFSFIERVDWSGRLWKVDNLGRDWLLLDETWLAFWDQKIHFLLEKSHFRIDFGDLILETATGRDLSVENGINIVLGALKKLISKLSIFKLSCFQ